MMETNKYYTPSLEEFCVGFEFEDSYGDGEYAKNSIDQLNIKDVIGSFLEKEVDIRVKYLDSEDIESLGFKFIKVGWSEASKIFRCNRYRGYELYLREGNTVHISTSSGLTMFEGVVKNKSMLKQVLKMIGVIEQ